MLSASFATFAPSLLVARALLQCSSAAPAMPDRSAASRRKRRERLEAQLEADSLHCGEMSMKDMRMQQSHERLQRKWAQTCSGSSSRALGSGAVAEKSAPGSGGVARESALVSGGVSDANFKQHYQKEKFDNWLQQNEFETSDDELREKKRKMPEDAKKEFLDQKSLLEYHDLLLEK